MATPRVTNRYPRHGERISPTTLREFLMEPVPDDLRGDSGEKELKLCDLDETVWDSLPLESIAKLSKIVIDRVAACHVRKVFQDRHFPRPGEGVRLEDLPLENRTRRCLAREGFEDNPRALGDYDIGEILAIRAFGPRCLVDLLCALESPAAVGSSRGMGGAREFEPCEELTLAAQQLAQLPIAELVRADDPRFSRLIREVDIEAGTAAELAERLTARTEDPPDPPYAAEQVRALISRIESMPELTLEEELIQIFGSTPCQRNRKLLIGYYGWEDGRQHTLAEIGDRFGITRERIRQICAALTRKFRNVELILAPVTDRVLAMLDERLPCAASNFEAELAQRGLTAVDMQLEGVATAAKLLGRFPKEGPAAFSIVKIDSDRLAVRPDEVEATMATVDLAKKEVYFHGLATVDTIEKAIVEKFPVGVHRQHNVDRELVVAVLPLIEGFSWLNEQEGWFRLLSISKHGLPKAVDKILAVSQEVSVTQMRTAMSRNRRLWKTPSSASGPAGIGPPEDVLLEFCRQTPGVRVEGDLIIADSPRDWRQALTGVEAKLVEVLKEHGPVMERGAMEDLCVADGMNRFSFHAFVSWSPVIAQFGHSVYGLLGASVSQEHVDALTAKCRARRASNRVLDNHGRTEDGKIWLSYRLSKAASTYAVITIPSALKKKIRGRFKLLDVDGEHVGTLATKDGRAWGLGAFMRQRNAQVDDYVVITLDLKKRTAVVELGPPPE